MFALVFMSSLSEPQQNKKKEKDVKLFVRAKSERWYIYVVDDCAWEAMPSGGGERNEETQIYHKIYTHTHTKQHQRRIFESHKRKRKNTTQASFKLFTSEGKQQSFFST